MKFVLNEIKLWFKDENSMPKNYEFLPNKVNVITGDATTGKTSFWSIIDYCLLANKTNIVNDVQDKVLWFGLRFIVNDKEISIVRRTPSNGVVSSDVYFNYGSFPIKPIPNKSVFEIKSILDQEFGVSDALKFPYGKDMGKIAFDISYRHFLLFNSLTEDIIGSKEAYFDTAFYGKEEYDKALKLIFDLVIGVNSMENIKALERLKEIESELKSLKRRENTNRNNDNRFKNEIFRLIEKCKQNNFIEYSEDFDNTDEAISIIKKIIANTKKKAENQKLFSEIDGLNKQKSKIRSQISAINKYEKEFRAYRKNLNKSADSLQPIEFLNESLSDQLLESYESKLFIESLEYSLKEIKTSLQKKLLKPVPVSGDLKVLEEDLKTINNRINQLNEINKNYQAKGESFIVIGEIKTQLDYIIKSKKHKPIDTAYLSNLKEEKERLKKVPYNMEEIKHMMNSKLNNSIQRNYNQLSSLPNYKNYDTIFSQNEMVLKLKSPEQLFPLDNPGSKSNYMFMHLCFYLGLHEHMIEENPEHVPQFLFIDQPSIPYFTGRDENKGNDDDEKLIDAFSLLNSFIEYIVFENKNQFQIFMVEHAAKEYWEDNNLSHFHLVDEFINGKGLIPNEIYNS